MQQYSFCSNHAVLRIYDGTTLDPNSEYDVVTATIGERYHRLEVITDNVNSLCECYNICFKDNSCCYFSYSMAEAENAVPVGTENCILYNCSLEPKYENINSEAKAHKFLCYSLENEYSLVDGRNELFFFAINKNVFITKIVS